MRKVASPRSRPAGVTATVLGIGSLLAATSIRAGYTQVQPFPPPVTVEVRIGEVRPVGPPQIVPAVPKVDSSGQPGPQRWKAPSGT